MPWHAHAPQGSEHSENHLAARGMKETPGGGSMEAVKAVKYESSQSFHS